MVAALVLAVLVWPAYRGVVAVRRHAAESAVTAEARRLGPFPGAPMRVFTKATFDSGPFPGKAVYGLRIEDPRPVDVDTAALGGWLARAGYAATTRPRPQPPHYQVDPRDPGNPAGCLVQGMPTRDHRGYAQLTRATIDTYPSLGFRCPDVRYRRHGFTVWVIERLSDQLRDRLHDHLNGYLVFVVRESS